MTRNLKPTIHDLPDTERPRERLTMYGASALSTAELLAIILGTGSRQENVLHLAERILAHTGGLHGLSQVTTSELEKIHGLGQAKVAQVVAAVELGRRVMRSSQGERPVIQTAAQAAELVMDMRSLMQEQIRVILLDTNSQLIAVSTVYIGTVNAAILRVSEVYREAITRNAPAMILVHNHPSGDPSPSPEDIQLTRRLIQAGEMLDISLLDHLIIGENEWRSLKEMGLAFRLPQR